MRQDSIDFREKIVRAAQEEGSSIQKTAQRFMVGKIWYKSYSISSVLKVMPSLESGWFDGQPSDAV